MRIIIVFIFLVLGLTARPQYTFKTYIKDNKVSLICTFLSGAFDGQTEVLSHHYYEFKRVFPNANDNFWNPDLSWRNKYNKPEIMQWFSDGYHISRFAQKSAMIGAIVTIKFNGGHKRPRDWLIQTLAHSVAYGSGFFLTYNVIYK